MADVLLASMSHRLTDLSCSVGFGLAWLAERARAGRDGAVRGSGWGAGSALLSGCRGRWMSWLGGLEALESVPGSGELRWPSRFLPDAEDGSSGVVDDLGGRRGVWNWSFFGSMFGVVGGEVT